MHCTFHHTPEYNPIEMAFSQIKSHYHRVSRAMSVQDRIEEAIRRVERSHCENYCRFVRNEITGEADRLHSFHSKVGLRLLTMEREEYVD